ncbi:MAG: ribosome biogenesis GTPase Der [Chloroflexota bacterium]
MDKPLVAIVGRANVGKSTLFNRIVGRRIAIVEDTPGTTRDRLYADASFGDREFTLIDTGGLEIKPGSSLAQSIRNQAQAAMAEADAILFVVDVRDGLTAGDWDIAESLRSSSVPVLLVANKADDPRHDLGAAEFNQLGLGEPVPVSAYHGRNLSDLASSLASLLPHVAYPPAQPGLMKVAIVGRPNVGKSMLLNAILGEERAIVSETPGTTRDSLDTIFDYCGSKVLLIDTAGLRRRGQVKAGIEYYSVLRALRAIARSDVSLLVIDGSEGVTAQDLHVAGYIHDAHKGMVLLVNKWDLVSPESREPLSQEIHKRFRFVPYAPVNFISAKLEQGTELVLPQAERVWKERQREVGADAMADFLAGTLARHNPPPIGTRQLKVFSAEQTGVNPPTFVFMVNDPELVHFSYRRYLENSLRQAFGFYGSPLHLVFRGRVRRRHPSSGREDKQGVE